MSRKVVVIGSAGNLGSCAAFSIATQNLADELVLIDTRKDLAEFYEMDIATAVTGIADLKMRVGSMEDLVGAEVVFMAVGAPWHPVSSRMECLQDNLPIMRAMAAALRQYCPGAVVLTATSPVDPMNYLLQRLSAIPRRQLLGYALNDSLRFRGFVAEALHVPPSLLDATVVGEHGEHQVPLFSSVRIQGQPVELNPETRARVRSEISKVLPTIERLGAGRTSGFTSSVGVAAIIRAVLQDTGEIFPCSVVLDGEYGRRRLSASVPVRLGRGGVREYMPLKIEEEEQRQLDQCFDFLAETVRALESELSAAAGAQN